MAKKLRKRRLRPARHRNATTGPAGGLSASWQAWLDDNLERGCDRDELFKILRDNGFGDEVVRQALGGGPNRPLDTILNPLTQTRPGAVSPATLAGVSITKTTQAVAPELAQVHVIDGFMTPEECARLVTIVDGRLRPSTVTDDDTPRDYRTSQTCDLGALDDDFITEIDERIARTVGIQLGYSEPIQAQRYDVGQQFRDHTDYFEPGTTEYEAHAVQRGQRSWTFMVYLNEAKAGGATRFPRLGQTFAPSLGRALAWNNLRPNGDPNPATLHAGMPVIAGRKYIITKWFRDRGLGELLFD